MASARAPIDLTTPTHAGDSTVDIMASLLEAGHGGGGSCPEAVAAASECLDRFTRAFNACDLAAMDAELHFPHCMLSDGQAQIWHGPGQHPPDLFVSLREAGWAWTRYTRREAVLCSTSKVHFVVSYVRCRADGSILSEHANLWIVTFTQGRWGIVCRSY